MKLPKIYNVYSPEQTYNINLINGQSINKIINNICVNITNKNDCITIMDQISYDYYGVLYTPSRLRSTIEDYYSQRTDILKYLTLRFKYKNYLEIGYNQEESFNEIKSFYMNVASVDPISGGTHRMTSDEFFQQNEQVYDLIYIDSDHSAEQVWKDIKNSLMALREGGTIVIHDVNPRLEDRQVMDVEKRSSTVWNGDVWKAATAVRLVGDYEIIVVDIDQGCGIIRKKPNKHLLPDVWHRSLIEIGSLPNQTLPGVHILVYEDLETHREKLLRLMSLVEMREWLEEP